LTPLLNLLVLILRPKLISAGAIGYAYVDFVSLTDG
jgi:hypothetical protein